MVGSQAGKTISPDGLRKEAEKIQFLFSLCASDDYDPAQENEGCELISSSRLPEAWFDDTLDFDNHLTSDSDEDVNVYKYGKRLSTQEEKMEAIKVRLNRFRRSTGPDEDKVVKEPNEQVPESKSIPPSTTTSCDSTGTQSATPKVEVPPVESAPAVVPPVVVPKLPIVPEVRPKAPNRVPSRKGPLKAVEPVPNMIKKSLSSDVMKSKPAVARGRLSSRPSSEQGPRRQDSPAVRRSDSVSPHRSGSAPSVKNPRPPLKLRGIRAKPIPAAGGKGKENRV